MRDTTGGVGPAGSARAADSPTIVGRSSSHFTRVTRMVAAELGLETAFEVVRDLSSTDSNAYGGHPALKIPTLLTSRGAWFGALNICRELWRLSDRRLRMTWPEDLGDPLLANAQELVLQAMATEVSLIMATLGGVPAESAYLHKLRRSLDNTLAWLEERAEAIFAALPPEREVSFLEITSFCLITHLDFRELRPATPLVKFDGFCEAFGQRPSARTTVYRFDP
ncbi:MAG: glutathione S-transferase domain-containing protein [Myxococcales bacterium]|nr:glutathione S-transferase domain-containing protein [Myxococcales bacterium]